MDDPADSTTPAHQRKPLKRDERFLAEVFAAMREGLSIVDSQQTLIHVNPALCNLTGFTPEELIGRKPPYPYWSDIDRKRIREALRLTLEEKFADYEVCLRNKSGGLVPVILSPSCLKDETGRVICYFATFKDNRERKRAELALRASEELNRRLLEALPGGLIQVALDGALVHANEKAQHILGLSYDEITHRIVADFEPVTFNEDGTPVRAADYPVSKCLETGQPQPPRVIGVRRPDGSNSWGIYTAVPLFDSQSGHLNGAVVTFLDITERKRMEEELRRREAELRSLTENVPDIVARFDRDLRHLYVNRQVEAVLGLPVEELLGKTHRELGVPEELAKLWESHLRRVLETGEPASAELTMPTPGGSSLFESRILPEFGPDGAVETLLCISRDITRQRLAEEERQRLETRMQHAQKLESLGVLAGGIAHDFNNLLSGILGYASLALTEMQPDSSTRESLFQIQTAARRAADLCRKLLAYSGRGKFVTQPIDLSELVKEMVHILRVSIPKKVRFEFALDGNLPAVDADATQLRQVAMNLITNAAGAIGTRAGTISIATGTRYCDREELSGSMFASDQPEGQYVFLKVTDTGVGMSSETLERIFDPFFTTKFTGRGLGLAAVLGIVRGHGGVIQVRSAPGKGSTFTVLLPASSRPSEDHKVEEVREVQSWQGRGTILVVDDEKAIRELSAKVLNRAGFDVLTAADGIEAIEVFSNHASEVALVILDMTMPRLDGADTLNGLRRIRPDLRAILTSGYNEQEAIDRVELRESIGFLQKPYGVDELLSLVRHVLERSAGGAPAE